MSFLRTPASSHFAEVAQQRQQQQQSELLDSALTREKVRSHIEHTLRTTTAATAAPPVLSITQLEGEAFIDALTGSCLRKELALLEVQTEHLQEDVQMLEEQKTCAAVRLERLSELGRLWAFKASECGNFMASLQHVTDLHRQALVEEHILKDKKLHLRSRPLVQADEVYFAKGNASVETITDKILHDQMLLVGAVAQLYDSARPDSFESKLQMLLEPEKTSGKGVEDDAALTLDSGSMLRPVAILRQRLELQKALARSMNESCITTKSATLSEAISESALLRVQEKFEERLTQEQVSELNFLHIRRKKLEDEAAERQALLTKAKEEVEATQRAVFMRRKQFIVTHRRLNGQERLPTGEYLTPAACREVQQRIRNELVAGRMDLLMSLAASDCAELRHMAFAHVATSLSLPSAGTPVTGFRRE